MSLPFLEENDQTTARREHLEGLRQLLGNVYPNKFERSEVIEPGREDTISAIVEKFRAFEPKVANDGKPGADEIESANQQLNRFTVRLAGRIASPPRVMGKALRPLHPGSPRRGKHSRLGPERAKRARCETSLGILPLQPRGGARLRPRPPRPGSLRRRPRRGEAPRLRP